jgi:hypothetical protein
MTTARMTQARRSAQTQARSLCPCPRYGSLVRAVARAASKNRNLLAGRGPSSDPDRISRVRPGLGIVHSCVPWPGHRYGSLVRLDSPGHRYGSLVWASARAGRYGALVWAAARAAGVLIDTRCGPGGVLRISVFATHKKRDPGVSRLPGQVLLTPSFPVVSFSYVVLRTPARDQCYLVLTPR